jgi:hypothetical protein
MKSSEYLYGIERLPSNAQIPKEVIDERIKLLNENLTEILASDWSTRDFNRVNDIAKAIIFWRTINDK